VRQAFISTAASCRPSIDILVRVENIRTKKPIYRIDIPEGTDKPYCTSSGLYKIRGEGQNIGIDPTMMKAIILERESEEFVARFKAATDELLKQIAIVHSDLAEQIAQAEFTASMAIEAAQAAEEAAIGAEMMAVI